MPDLNAPLSEWGDGKLGESAEIAGAIHEERTQPEANPAWKDSELMAPTSEWDRADREGTCGTGARLFMMPGSRRYQERYGLIDWSK